MGRIQRARNEMPMGRIQRARNEMPMDEMRCRWDEGQSGTQTRCRWTYREGIEDEMPRDSHRGHETRKRWTDYSRRNEMDGTHHRGQRNETPMGRIQKARNEMMGCETTMRQRATKRVSMGRIQRATEMRSDGNGMSAEQGTIKKQTADGR
ncbi:hypothetical protein AVEN_184615-1 [Araneus ventricosus]|uniref:Uncharacterized protein n=1 Tax=Araneus ventricosus TaxID=182803 RepID=A0A4Y2E7Q6_ARAVE|nr:hypothetical protein AVEN_184615-1 [Araneus ventricosus]